VGKKLRRIWVDGTYRGKLVDWVATHCQFLLQPVLRSDDVKGFVVLPRRWVVERTFAWLTQCRRLSKEYEGLPSSSEAMIHIAMTRLMLRLAVPGVLGGVLGAHVLVDTPTGVVRVFVGADLLGLGGLILLEALGALEKSERARRAQVLLARWNKLTERFAALVSRFQKEAPGPVTSHSKRFESLSVAFNTATRDDRLSGQQQAVEGAEATVRALARDIRAARPEDCGLQKDVLGALVR